MQERLAAQKEEALTNPEYSTTFKDQLTKGEKQQRRKAVLASIGAPGRPLPSRPAVHLDCLLGRSVLCSSCSCAQRCPLPPG